MIGTQQDHTCDVLKCPSARTTWIVVQLVATVYLAFHARTVTLTMATFLETKADTKHMKHWIITYQQEHLQINKIKTIEECRKFGTCIFVTTMNKSHMLPFFGLSFAHISLLHFICWYFFSKSLILYLTITCILYNYFGIFSYIYSRAGILTL